MITPRKVVEEMAFSKSKSTDQPSLEPAAQAPAAPPPPPPASYFGADDTSPESDPLLPPSYQHNGMYSRAAAPPTIRHYEDPRDDPRSFFTVRGDPSLRPNTGETNSYDTAIFGLALSELLENLRLTNMVASSTSILLLLAGWFFRLITAQIAKLVLSAYLAFLSCVLLLVELASLWKVSSLDVLKDNFGLVFHPIGKVVYTYLCASLCWGVGELLYYLVGVLFFGSASLLLLAWILYPEFRRPFEREDEERPAVATRGNGIRWSAYSNSFSSFVKTSSEAASLLSEAMRKSESAPV